jgi:glycosyltransferase involved in cell wall biosynthesis
MYEAQVGVVMPAYNAGRTLRPNYEALPKEHVNRIILADDGSTDHTIDVARELNLEVFRHNHGANQKTCHTETLKADAEIAVMVHRDYQHDPTLLTKIIQPIVDRKADSRIATEGRVGSVARHAVVEIHGDGT